MNLEKFQLVLALVICVVTVSNGQGGNPTARDYLNLYAASPYRRPSPPAPPAGILPILPSEDTELLELLNKYDLRAISALCPRDALFSSFHPTHAEAVEILTGYFAAQPNSSELVRYALAVKPDENIHPKVWYTAFNRARLSVHTPNLDATNTIHPMELFPSTFFPAEVINACGASPDKCCYFDESIGANNGIENLLWYFREDVQLVGHHWVWHLLYPSQNRVDVPFIDRRGESFSFVHHDFQARYTAERLSNGLLPQKPLNLRLDTIVEEGYDSHLVDGISRRTYPPRKANRPFYDSLIPSEQELYNNTIVELEHVIDAINRAGIVHKNGFLGISADDQIDTLGDIAEASVYSVNPKVYGELGYHNNGHDLLSFIDAPLNPKPNQTKIRDQGNGVMGHAATTWRDPIFFRWHHTVDLIFQAYKLKHLTPYLPHGGQYPLVYEGITVHSVQVVPDPIQGRLTVPLLNHLETFWGVRSFDFTTRLDFSGNGSLNICAKHLDHQEFTYHINIQNSHPYEKLGTVRIFLAPRFKSIHQRRRYTMLEQRRLFFTLDSFQVTLPPGNNILTRRSVDSTLTTGWPKSFREIDEEIRQRVRLRSVCDCGFPQHLLLPKGTPTGMVFDLFVMITDGVQDQVTNNATTQPPILECTPSHIHCGIRGSKYPDSKPMGYPFDRRPYNKNRLVQDLKTGQNKIVNSVVENLEDYVRDIPNMHASQIVVQHHNEIRGQVPPHGNYL